MFYTRQGPRLNNNHKEFILKELKKPTSEYQTLKNISKKFNLNEYESYDLFKRGMKSLGYGLNYEGRWYKKR